MKIYDLPEEDRKFYLAVIRGLLVHTGVARREGLEYAEELAVKLIDSHMMVVCFSEDMQACWFELTPFGKKLWGRDDF